MLLSELLSPLPTASVVGADVRVGRVTDSDSDFVVGDCFVAIRGGRVDGHDRVARLPSPAVAVVDRMVPAPAGVTLVVVPDTRGALAVLAAQREGNPGRDMAVIGVTGTNGKTSTTFLLAAMGRAAGWKVGVVGTTGHFIDEEAVPTAHTTPTAPVLQSLLARMRDAGCRMVAMEVSSIGLAARRCDAIPFRAAIFTNLTRDHLDYHGTMEDYAAAKGRLFHELLDGTAVLNANDPMSKRMVPAGQESWWFNGADLSASDVDLSATGARANFHTPAGDFAGTMQLLGAHAVDNALAALGGALAAGIPLDACRNGLAALPCVPGRLEPVPNERGIAVLVDYAHTDDALTRVLASLRSLTRGRVITVFGCGGDRDRGKRPLMGRAAADGSDVVVVTSDNPRGEDPLAIIADILPGVGDRPQRIEPDRLAAIRLAISLAEVGDVVLIAGKGHEATQEVAGRKIPFDDRLAAAEVLA